MDATLFIIALIAGPIAAILTGALSGVAIGAKAIGTELAAYMGGLYGLLSGAITTAVGLVIVVAMNGGLT